MRFYSYRVEHDYGLAPNPFGGYCTLAVCKGQIRNNKKLAIGDWIIGFGTKALGVPTKLIYAMRVDEIITFDEYWNDIRFAYKKPVINGSLVQMYGDNFYHTVNGVVMQENSAHSKKDGTENEGHKQKDTEGKNVLISKHFYYFGDACIDIPTELKSIIGNPRPIKSTAIPEEVKKPFLDWLSLNFQQGINGDPISWVVHLKKKSLICYLYFSS
jgi:hypothetical protein